MTEDLNIFERMDRLPFTREHKKIWGILTASWFVDGVLEGSPGFIVAAAATDMHFNATIAALISSGFGIGLLIGSIVLSYISDAIGRNKVFQIDILTMALAALGAALSPSWPFLFAFIIIMSWGIAGLFAVDNAYMSELLPRGNRGFIQDLMIVSLIPGLMISALLYLVPIVFPIIGFRIYPLILAIMGFAVFPFRRALPESVRWLVSRKKYEEADQVVRKLEASAGEKYIYKGKILIPQVKVVARARPSLFLNRNYLKYTIYGMVGWFVQFFAFSFNTFIPVIFKIGLGVVKQTVFTTVLILLLADSASLISRLFTTFTIDILGRKFNMLFGMLVGGIGVIVWAYPWTHIHSVPFAYLVIPMMLFQFVNSWFMGFTVSYPELFPVEARSMAYGFPAAVGRVAAIVTPYLVLAFQYNEGLLFYIIGALTLAVAFATLFIIPETKKMNIEFSSKDPVLYEKEVETEKELPPNNPSTQH